MAMLKFSGSYIQQTIRKADYNFAVDEADFLLWLDEEQDIQYNSVSDISVEELEYWLAAYAYGEVLPEREVVEGDGECEWEDVVVA